MKTLVQILHRIITPLTNMSTTRSHHAIMSRHHRIPASPPNKHPIIFHNMAMKQHNIPSIQPFVLNKPAPTLGQHIALTTVPIRVAEAPHGSGLVLET
ncbi:hypothetical protein HanRHA438_Chr13g0593061 [Helianthus annuus]|nr:hypothetical protein HanRHA438_Chr13g0593061 [Helianthus annuus]